MNFYGHLVVGQRFRTSQGFLLGTMLPDFASMAGLRRLSADAQSDVSIGIRFHHDTDAVFHRAAEFVDMNATGTAALERQGLARGTARAVSHVGLELLLDGLLTESPPSHQGVAPLTAYQEALAYAGTTAAQARIETDRGVADPRFGQLVERLARAPLPHAYREPAFVAERLERILARRPRLAMGPDDRPRVEAWLTAARPQLQRRVESLLEQVHAGLGAS